MPIHKVINLNGTFRSSDIKDYLSIPPNRKLFLVTCAPDNYQELLWRKSNDLNFQRLNIDYWFPAHFSIYDNDAKLYQFVSAKRQLLHAAWTQSQFTWFRLGENIPIEFLKPIRNSISVIISTQQMFSQRNRDLLHNEVKIADKWFSKETSFYIVGKSKNLPLSNERSFFEINSSWIIRALKGRTIDNKINRKIDIKELLICNLREVMENV